MNNTTSALWGYDNNTAVLKLSGEWRFEKSPILDQLIHIILPTTKAKQLVIDLEAVTAIDSTILGLLAQISMIFQHQSQQKPDLVVMHPEITEILLSMAFDTLFQFMTRPPGTYPPLMPLIAQKVDEDVLKENVLHSHKTLTSLSENNKKAFADLIRMLS